MYSDEASCSDCKLELITYKWNQLLLKWLNKCVNSNSKVAELNPRSLVDVINKYKHDICADDIDRAILCTDDIEPFIRYKYPILRLRYLSEDTDLPKKLYILTSMLLFHSCINSQMGLVDRDICDVLNKNEQMIILKFCERLKEMEATVNNVECAIKDAYEMVSHLEDSCPSTSVIDSETEPSKSSSNTEAFISSETIKDSLVTIQSDDAVVTDSVEPNVMPAQQFNSLMTVMPYVVSDTTTYSDFISTHNYSTNDTELEVNTNDTDACELTEVKVFKIEENAKGMKQKFSQNKMKQPQSNHKQSLSQKHKVSHKDLVQNVNEKAAFNRTAPQKVSQKQNFAQHLKEGADQRQALTQKHRQNKISAKSQNVTDKKEGAARNQTSGKKSTAQNDSADNYPTQKQSITGNLKVKQKESASKNQGSIKNEKSAPLRPRVIRRKEVASDVLNQLVTQQKKAAAAVLDQLVTQQKKAAAAALNQLVTQQQEGVAAVLNKLVTQQKEETISAFNECVKDEEGAVQDPNKIAPQKAFAQKATVTHKEGDVQADSTEIKRRRCLEDCVCSRCSASDPCCGDFGNTMGTCERKQPDKIPVPPLSPPEQKAPVWSSPESSHPGQPLHSRPPPGQLNPASLLLKPAPEHSGESLSEDSQPEEPYEAKFFEFKYSWKVLLLLMGIPVVTILIIILAAIPFLKSSKPDDRILQSCNANISKLSDRIRISEQPNTWECVKRLCHRVYQPKAKKYASYSQCSLVCMGPQLWPYPVGHTFFSNKIVSIATSKLEYKFQSVPSEIVHQHLAEAFKLFLGDLARLENTDSEHKKFTKGLNVRRMYIQIDVETDPDPRLRLDTEESYSLKIESSKDQVVIKIASPSFCGVRHGLETLSQLILLDQSSGHLITLSNTIIKDAPSYRYRGLMIDTGRNYIPIPDIMRTIDAMATCKLNTFHWRISDVTSFPLLLPQVPQLFEYGAYDRSMVYTKEDVVSVVNRAGIRGVRVLIEVAAPGPVGRAWSWSRDASCPTKTDNFTCANVLCLRINMQDSILDVLQTIYSEIIEMTKVNDIFHLSDSVFSLSKCFFLIEEREGFLAKALERLKLANKGHLPKLPVIWYTSHLTRDYAAKTWNSLGVQLYDWQHDSADQFLSKFKVIHSSKWDLSCEMKNQRCNTYRTWQEMYSWRSWRNIEVFTIEGGEAILWADLVNSGNLDDHLWPRAAAVAERLWSDVVGNTGASGSVYVRLDSHRWRMLLRGVKVQPVWPVWCSFNPGSCLKRVH